MNPEMIRTDLALESRQAYCDARGHAPDGAELRHRTVRGFDVDELTITGRGAARRLGKPAGRYVTVTLDPVLDRREGAFDDGAACLAGLLREFACFPEAGPVLMVGLGNRAMTPDALGPLTAEHVLVTRHLIDAEKEIFGNFRSVAALAAGVLGTTGLEAGELVRSVKAHLRPALIIAVDALAARGAEKLCRTVQLTDAGIVPGSGVGNARQALNARLLGVPVLCLGVPTVVDAAVLARDLFPDTQEEPQRLARASGLFVTPRDIDARVADCARLIACGINLALHPYLTVRDLDLLME